jgi:hypothetical protein
MQSQGVLLAAIPEVAAKPPDDELGELDRRAADGLEFQRQKQRVHHRERQRGGDGATAVLDVPRSGVNGQALRRLSRLRRHRTRPCPIA